MRIPRSPYAQVQLVREGDPPKDDRHRPHGSPQDRQAQVQERIQGGNRRRLSQEERVNSVRKEIKEKATLQLKHLPKILSWARYVDI